MQHSKKCVIQYIFSHFWINSSECIYARSVYCQSAHSVKISRYTVVTVLSTISVHSLPMLGVWGMLLQKNFEK